MFCVARLRFSKRKCVQKAVTIRKNRVRALGSELDNRESVDYDYYDFSDLKPECPPPESRPNCGDLK